MEPAAATLRTMAPPIAATLFPLPARIFPLSCKTWSGGRRRGSALLRCIGAASQEPPLPVHAPTEGLVFEVGAAGEWDSLEVGSPVVKRYVSDESERWMLWYHGRGDGSGESVGLATSANGIHWKRESLVVGRSDDWWAFDKGGLCPGDVITMSSDKVNSPAAFYWMYYGGYATAAENNGLCWLPGLAISQDGRNWARIEGEHHTNALFDVGEAGEWDSQSLAPPRVVFHAVGDLRMYYHAFDADKGEFGIGVARSRDGINWTKLGKVLGGGPRGEFDEGGVVRGHVVKGDAGYLMAYEGVAADGRRSIGVAESRDGLRDWRRRSGGPVLEASTQGGWDDGGVGSPCLVQMDGKQGWRIYYAGIGRGGGGSSGIGMALSSGLDMRIFQRCSLSLAV